MRKNNIWNNIFHSAEIKNNKLQMALYEKQDANAERLLNNLSNCISLTSLINIHKDAWNSGFKHKGIAPDPYGIFRTKDILTMTSDEIYLGGIYGLFTHTIYYWEQHKEDKYGCNGFGIAEDCKIYNLLVSDYKYLLQHVIKSTWKEAKENIIKYKKLGY